MNTPLANNLTRRIFSSQSNNNNHSSGFNLSSVFSSSNRDKETSSNNFKDKNTSDIELHTEKMPISNTDSVNFKPSFFLNSENLKTNFTMKSLNSFTSVSFSKKDSTNNSLNTIKKNLIPNLNNNNDIECYLASEKKSICTSRYNKILSEHKIINNYETTTENQQFDINEKLDYILNSKKKRNDNSNTRLLKKKRKQMSFRT